MSRSFFSRPRASFAARCSRPPSRWRFRRASACGRARLSAGLGRLLDLAQRRSPDRGRDRPEQPGHLRRRGEPRSLQRPARPGRAAEPVRDPDRELALRHRRAGLLRRGRGEPGDPRHLRLPDRRLDAAGSERHIEGERLLLGGCSGNLLLSRPTPRRRRWRPTRRGASSSPTTLPAACRSSAPREPRKARSPAPPVRAAPSATPQAVAFDSAGKLYVVDSAGRRPGRPALAIGRVLRVRIDAAERRRRRRGRRRQLERQRLRRRSGSAARTTWSPTTRRGRVRRLRRGRWPPSRRSKRSAASSPSTRPRTELYLTNPGGNNLRVFERDRLDPGADRDHRRTQSGRPGSKPACAPPSTRRATSSPAAGSNTPITPTSSPTATPTPRRAVPGGCREARKARSISAIVKGLEPGDELRLPDQDRQPRRRRRKRRPVLPNPATAAAGSDDGDRDLA